MKCPKCSKSYPSGVTQCGDCGVQLASVAAIKLNPAQASSDTMVDWNNPSAESLDNDLAGWWDQGPAALDPSESIEFNFAAAPPPPIPSAPEPPAPASFSLGSPPVAKEADNSLHDSWGASPASLSIQDSRFASESGSFGESSAGTSAGTREQTLSNNWAQLEAPLDDSWSPPPEPTPGQTSIPEPEITIPKLPERREESGLPPGAPKIGFDSMPEHEPEPPPRAAMEAEEEPAPLTTVSSGGSLGRSLLLVLVVVLLGVGGFYYTSLEPEPEASPAPVVPEIEHDAATWMASAQKSLESQNYALAVPQLERAVELLKAEEAEPERVKEARLELAQTYARNKQFKESREVWKTLGLAHPDLSKQASEAVKKAERQLRIQANGKIKRGKSQLKERPRMALTLGQEALQDYTDFGGQRGQLAEAHGLIAEAFRAESNKRRAAKHYKLAHDYNPKGPYLKRLRSMGPVITRPPRKRKPVPVKKPRFIPKSSIPKAK